MTSERTLEHAFVEGRSTERLPYRICVKHEESSHEIIRNLRTKFSLHVVLQPSEGELIIGFNNHEAAQEIRGAFRDAGVLIEPERKTHEKKPQQDVR